MAKEQLYRRGTDGFLEPVLPEARGKAAAFNRWLAQGEGKPKRMANGGKFKKGPMKGLTYDQAKVKFEEMWAKAPDTLKEKYAQKSNNDLAPSERRAAGIDAPLTKPMTAPDVQKARMKSYGHEFDPQGNAVPINRDKSKDPKAPTRSDRDGNGIPDLIQRPIAKPPTTQTSTPPPAQATPAIPAKPSTVSVTAKDIGSMASAEEKAAAMAQGLTISRNPMQPPTVQTAPAPGSDEARAAALTESSRNERFNTADTGDGGMSAAIAMDKYQGKPVSAPIEKTPIERGVDSAIAANTRFWDKTTGAVNSAVAAPFTPPSDTQIGDQQRQAANRDAEARQAAANAEQDRITRENIAAKGGAPQPVTKPAAQPVVSQPAPMPVAGTPVTNGMQTDERMHAQDKTNAGQTPVVKAPPTPPLAKPGRIGATPAGQELIGMKKGVPQYAPMSEVYGQSPRAADTAPIGGVGPVRPEVTAENIRANYQRQQSTPQARAGAQRMMERDGVVPPMTKPVPSSMRGPASQQPQTGTQINRPRTVTTGVEANAANEMRRQAGINANGPAQRPPSSSPVQNMSEGELEKASGRRFFTGKVKPLDQLVKGTSPNNAPLTRPQPVSTRVIGSRPATPEEVRTRTPMKRPVMLAR